MADQVQDSLLREIDEEIRQEKFEKLWKRYGSYVIAAAVALVVAVAGYQGWQSWDFKNRTEQSDRFVAALETVGEGKLDEARQAFDELAADADTGYALLARLREAAALAERDDPDGAAKIYDSVAADTSNPKMFRDLATLLAVLNTVDQDDTATSRARLTPLAADDSPWRFSAKELLGLIAQRNGEIDKAREIYQALSQDGEAPAGVRSRAAELLAALG